MKHLRQANNLSERTLTRNQQGRMTIRQRLGVAGNAAGQVLGVMLFGMVCVAAVAIITSPETPTIQRITIGVLLCVFGWFTLSSLRSMGMALSAALTNRVQTTECRLQRTTRIASVRSSRGIVKKTRGTYYQCGERVFPVPQAGFDALPQPIQCRVYYVPLADNKGILLNIEEASR